MDKMEIKNDKMSYVERYLAKGWGLTPVGAPKMDEENSGKTPFLKGWPENPVRDMETARSHWDNAKGYNVGILTGEISGLIVLDIDCPEKFTSFLEKHPECKGTYIVHRNNAPEGRNHYYFKTNGFVPKTMTCKTTGWGDLCSNKKQVVAPPSVHYTGGIYEVVHEAEPLPFKKEYMDDLLIKSVPKKKEASHEESLLVEEAIPEGSRNNELFALCRELRDQGMVKEDVEDAALAFCEECNPPYPEEEALKTVESVFKYNRPQRQKKTLARLNYVREEAVSEDGDEPKFRMKALTYDKVTERIAGLLKGKAANVYGDLVWLPSTPEEKPFPMRTSVDLFSRMGIVFEDTPDWMKGKNFMSKDELFSALKVSLPHLGSIETVPHYPPMKNIHYVLPELPPPDMGALEILLDFFSPETPEDRSLILAMFLTTLWGGPAGQRAPFLITSKDGRGVGKSTLAETASKLLEQVPIQASTRLDSDALITRLLSWDAMKSRIVLFDNEVGAMQKISNAGMASLLTASQISGKKLYVGEGQRPNHLVWIMTLNSVTLDSDFASRCIPIALKKPRPCVNWQEKLNDFIEEKRWVLLSAMLDLLKRPTEAVTPMTRWGLWENQVLSKVPGLDREEVLNLITARQKNNDNDLDEKEMILDALSSLVENSKKDRKTYRFFISNPDMAELVRDALHLKLGNSWGLRQVKDIIAKGDYRALKVHRNKNMRGFIWNETGNEEAEVVNLHWTRQE